MTTRTTTCIRCNGTGTIYAFTSIANGRCFGCGGSGTCEISAATESAIVVVKEDAKRAWLASLAPMTHSQVVAKFRALSEDKLWAVRDACAAWDAPGARLAYWAACSILNAWPGDPIPAVWITAA